MPESIKQRHARGLYTKKELANQKAGTPAAKKARNTSIIKSETSKQKSGSMYKGKGSDIAITTSAPTVKKSASKPAAKPATRPVTAKIQAPAAKGPSGNAAYTQSIGARQIDSPTNFRSSQASNLDGMNKNFSSGNRIANRASKTRGKGEDALAAGNLRKAKRLRRRYDRQTKRLGKKLK